MDRNTDIVNMKVSINDGKNVPDTTLCKAGAKDSLSGTNTTDKFETAYSCKGPFGGEKKN